MFIIYENKFGNLEELVIKNEETGEYLAILPEYGGIVRKIVLYCKDDLLDVLKVPKTEEELRADDAYPSAIMFPFPSRIANGQYEFEGKNYQLPINDVQYNAAIHGFVAHRAFEFYDKKIEHDSAEITLVHRYQGDYEGYPFPFELFVTYVLNEEFGFQLKFSVKNTGTTALPAAFGWHAYFKITNQSVDQLEIQMDDISDEILLDEKMMPKSIEMYDEEGYLPLKGVKLDNAYKVEVTGNGSYIELLCTETDQNLIIWQETGINKFNYVVIYTPESRDCVAIEPITSNVNAFNNKQGLITIQPNQVVEASIRVRFD
jgi:aldose 1-epimerase